MRTLAAADFVLSRPPAALAASEIHLWFLAQDAAVTDHSNHGVRLRELLASYLDVPAEQVQIERDTHGKPYLAAPAHAAQLQFNLSHTGALLLVGISHGQALGVDLETQQRKRPWLDLAQRYFAADETAALAALPPTRQAAAFVDLWSCKEAVLKAIGRGIAFGLQRLSFALDANGSVTRLTKIAAEAGTLAQWNVVRLAPAAGLLGALAWHGPARGVRAFRAGPA